MAKKEIKNKYDCCKGIWKKFSDKQKLIYNSIRSYKQGVIAHPNTDLPKEEWATLSHNFACLAAWES